MDKKQKLSEAIKSGKIIDATTASVFVMTEDLKEEVDKKISDLKVEVKEKIEQELPNLKTILTKIKGEDGNDGITPTDEELISLIKPLIPEVKDGNDGKDYILTEKDKKEIAKSIKVPVIEKIIEKTIVEQPIITNEIKEVAVADTGEQIVDKINELPIEEEYQIGIKHILGLEDYSEVSRLAKTPRGFGGGSTARNFYQLNDTPDNYVGQALKALRVKADESGLEFFTGSGLIDWGEIGGTITDQTDLTTYLSTNYVPYTGANADVNLGSHNLLVGSTASLTDFPLAKIIGSAGNTGHTYTGNIGTIGEAVASATDTATGVGGVASTNGANQGRGVAGVGKVSATGDGGASIGGYFRAEDTHAGGRNIGLYAFATGGASNHALYLAGGDIYTPQQQNWTLYDNYANALRFNSTGKADILNIVTTDGAEGVTMSGTLGVTGLSTLTGGLITSFISPSADSTTAFQIRKADKTTSVLNVDTTNGRVGIGTTAPDSKLAVYGSSGTIQIAAESGSDYTAFFANGTYGPAIHWKGATQGDLRFGSSTAIDGTGFSEKMRITSGGNVGIGTTAPNAKLESLATTEQLRLSYDSTHYTSFTIASNGNLSLGGTTGRLLLGGATDDGTSALQVNGSINAGWGNTVTGTNAMAFGESSTASGDSSTASGYASTASGYASTAFGFASTASGDGSTASGDSSTASGEGSTALGYASTAFGAYSTASGDFSVASGNYSTASGEASTALGSWLTSVGIGSVAAGYNNDSNNQTDFTAGSVSTYGSIAMGYASYENTLKATGTGSVAMGQDVNAITNNNVLVFGQSFTATTTSSFNVGFGQTDFQVTSGNVKVNGALNITSAGTTLYTLPTTAGSASTYLGYNASGTFGWNTVNSMVYPSAGIAVSTGSGWGTSITDNSANWNTAYSNRITSLTTTGSSGAATLSSNTLNIPNYTLAGLGGQASSTNLTSLSNLTYSSTSFVKMTASGTFALDTNTYMANPMTAIGQLIYGGASGTPTTLAAGTSGQLLQSAGSAAPAWTTATYPATTSANQVLYSTATNTIGATSSFTFDGTTLTSSGGFATASSSTGVTISGSNGILTMAGNGNTNNENVLFNFESTANQVGISSTTGVTALSIGGLNFTSTGTGSFTSGITTSYGTSAPTQTTNGQIGVAYVGTAARLYFYANGTQYYIDKTGGFGIPGYETTDPISGDKMAIGDFIVGMIDQNLGDAETAEESSLHGVWVKWSSVKAELLEELKSSTLAGGYIGSGTVSTVSTGTANFLDKITNVLSSLGITIANGVTNIAKLTTEKITAKVATVDYLQMVASNGDIYCTWIDENGEWQKAKGECSSQEVAIAQATSSTETSADQALAAANAAASAAQEAAESAAAAETAAAESASSAVESATQLDIVSVADISDIEVEYGQAPVFPSTVEATLSDGITANPAVTWDAGTPTFDANTAGTYAFIGTITTTSSITNTNNLTASLNVIVKEQAIAETTAETEETTTQTESVGEMINDASASLLSAMWNFINWILGFFGQKVSGLIPSVAKNATASLSSSVVDGFRLGLGQISGQMQSAIQQIGNIFKK